MPRNLSAGRPLLWRSAAAVHPRRSSTSSNSPKAAVYSIAKSFKESEDIEEGFLTPERKTPDRSQSGRGVPPHFFAKGQNVNKEVYLDVMQT
ncbi:Hypothetical protein FKW44_022412, partial [Caligus rogercresseyi]